MPSVASRLKKNMIRTKQKILQGMGLDMNRTNDHNFDIYAQQFEQQHKQASKLTHDLNKYLNCLKETQRCSKAFYETLKETYEPNWPDSHLFYEQIQLIEYKWLDYLARLNNDVQLPLIAYSNEFPELKKKIEKRANRLIDYDNARQALLNIQNKTAKQTSGTNTHSSSNSHNSLNNNGRNNNTSKSEQIHSTENLTKITKLKIDLEDKQHIYEEINQTLCMSLPVLYENRIKFYSSLFQTFFHAETLFYSDCAEIKTKLDSICEMLSNKTISSTQAAIAAAAAAAAAAGTSSNSSSTTSNQRDNGNDSQNDESQDENSSDSNINSNKMNELPFLKISPPKNASTYINNNSHSHNISLKDDQENNDLNSTSTTNYYTTRTSNTVLNNSSNNNNNNNSSYLYKVKAAYAYSAKELDELTFSKDDSIQVVEGTESEKEDLDDGWLIGIHESTNKRGIFPENFTRRI